MSEVKNRIPFDEFSENLARILARVISEGEAIVVETEDGNLVTVSPLSPPVSNTKTEEDWRAFRAAAGGWADVDTDALLEAIYESRKSSRPPVEL